MDLFSNDALGVALPPFLTVRDVNLEPIDEMEPPTTAATATSMSSLVAPAGKRYRGVRQRPWGKWTDMSGYECVPVIFPANNSVPEFPVYRRSSSFSSLIPCLSETWGDLPLKVDDAEDMVIYGFLRDAVSVGWTPFNLTAADINGDYAQLNFPNLHHSGSHISGNFGKYKQLHSAVDAKLIAICQSLVQGKSNAQLNSECLGNGKTKEDAPGFSLDVNESTPKHNLTSQSLPNESLAVDQQEGIPQYSDTLPTDQALAVTVDTNSVGVKEILPPQFLPIARQEKPNEDFGGDKIEAVGMGGEGAGEGEMEEDQLIVDEEGSPQLINSDNLPSDQATAVTVDTNSVVGKEIPPLQFSRTAQHKNSDEAFGNEEGEIWAKTTEENGIADGQFDSRCSAKRKRKEKNPRRERRNKKTTGVRIGTPLEDNLQTKGRSLKNDAKRPKGVKPTKFEWRGRLRQRELKVGDTLSSKKQSKFVKGGTSRNTSRRELPGSNVDVNTAGGQASLEKRLTSFSGKRGLKIAKPCFTELANENEGEVLDRAFRSSLRGIMMLIKELNLRTCHKEVLKRTPFWGMFEAIIENKLSPTQCRQRGKIIIEIINTYDPVTRKFQLGRQSMELTRVDMVSIFGISCGKEFVNLKYGCKEDVKLVARREISESRLTSTSLKQLLQKYVGSDEKEDVEDVARLLCVYLCHTFFFSTGTTVKWVYLERIEDLDRLRDYDWNEAIINELMSSIRKHHREPRKVTGCVMALMYWLCEHTNLSKADDSEHPLGIVKWNIPVVVSKLKKLRLKDLKPHQVVSRQANVAETADDEVPVYKDIVQDSVSLGDVPVSNRGNDACSGNGKRDEKTRRGERVCRSKLKRVHQDYNIHASPPREEPTLIGQSHPNESPAAIDQERIAQLNFDTLLPSNQNSGTSNTNSVTVRAKYKGVRIKFDLSWPWQKLELEQEVKKRLQLDAATYYINYKDEDGEMTLIGCDEDLEGYISSIGHQGTRLIDLFLEPK